MDIKKKIREYYLKEYTYPVTMLAVKMDIEDYFMYWLDNILKKYPKETKDKDVYEIVDFLVKKLNLNKNIFFLHGAECCFSTDNECYIGISLEKLNHNFSLTRMKIDFYNDLVKMGILFREDDIDIIYVYSEVYMMDEKDIKEIEKEKNSGSVQKNSKE